MNGILIGYGCGIIWYGVRILYASIYNIRVRTYIDERPILGISLDALFWPINLLWIEQMIQEDREKARND
jgi:predicted outer membrane lipoprotein